MSFLKDLGSFVTGGLIDSAFNRHNAQRQVDMSDASWRYRQSNAIQLTQEDMRKANLNPILAVTQGATSGVGSATPSAMDNSKSIDYINARNVREQLKIDKYNAQTNRMAQLTNAKAVDSQVALNSEKAKESQANQGLLAKKTDETTANIDNIKANTDTQRQALENMKVSYENLVKTGLSIISSMENDRAITMAKVNHYNASVGQIAQSIENMKKAGYQIEVDTHLKELQIPHAASNARSWEHTNNMRKEFWFADEIMGNFTMLGDMVNSLIPISRLF